MLRRAFHQRPTCKSVYINKLLQKTFILTIFLYRDLSLYPYVQECLGLTKSSLFKGASNAGKKFILYLVTAYKFRMLFNWGVKSTNINIMKSTYMK